MNIYLTMAALVICEILPPTCLVSSASTNRGESSWNAPLSPTRAHSVHKAVWNYNKAIDAENAGDTNLAVALYTKALKFNPGMEEAYVNRGNRFTELGKSEKALADYNKAIELDPEDALAHDGRARQLDLLGHWKEAIVGFKKAIALEPNLLGSYLGIGHCNEKLKHFDKAIIWFSRAIELDPKSTDSLRSRALMYLKTLQTDLALKDIEAAKVILAHDPRLDTFREIAIQIKNELSDPKTNAKRREEMLMVLQGRKK